ncbi:MAG: hypothetical protein H0U86_01835 [Chloroflexi bacterium]|nr:hypothetical protein [Chloroflexota bacterium]
MTSVRYFAAGGFERDEVSALPELLRRDTGFVWVDLSQVLPITAIASIYGMNIIVNAETQATQIVVVIVLMVLVTAGMLAWTKRLGWL